MADKKLTELTEATEVDLTDQLYAVVGETSNRITLETLRNALIERGSNSNGEFVRFADGTQICFMHRTASLEELTFSFTYPAAFAGDAQGIFASWGALNSTQRDVVKSHYTRVEGSSLGSTSGELVFQDNDAEAGSSDVYLVAYGRWF